MFFEMWFHEMWLAMFFWRYLLCETWKASIHFREVWKMQYLWTQNLSLILPPWFVILTPLYHPQRLRHYLPEQVRWPKYFHTHVTPSDLYHPAWKSHTYFRGFEAPTIIRNPARYQQMPFWWPALRREGSLDHVKHHFETCENCTRNMFLSLSGDSDKAKILFFHDVTTLGLPLSSPFSCAIKMTAPWIWRQQMPTKRRHMQGMLLHETIFDESRFHGDFMIKQEIAALEFGRVFEGC